MAPGSIGGCVSHDSFSSEFVVLRNNKRYRDYVKEENLPVLNGMSEKMENFGWVAKRFTDREPGELSSESSSGIEDGVKGSEEKDEISSGKKRKFSHLELDINNDQERILFKQTTKSHTEVCDFKEQMEEDYDATNGVSFSRWADKNDSFGNEGDASDLDLLPKWRKIEFFAPAEDRRLESGEFIAAGGDGICREACSNPKEDDIDSLDISGGNSNGEESDGSIEGCRVRTLDYVERPDRNISMFNGCRTVDEFEKLNKINEGTYGIVYRAKDKRSGEIVALKKVKMEKEREGFPLTSLREINILLSLHHPSIVKVKEVVVGRDLNCVFTVMEYMDHDLKGLIERMKKPFHLSEIKCLMLQLIAGVKYLHDNWVLHRDLKTSNILFNNRGELKICDFGLSRQYGSPLKPYTKLVVTLWYRAPELLLGAKEYSTAIDMWSLGCIMAELLTKEPLFPGKSEVDQLDKIFRILGTPDEKIWPGFSRLPGAKVKFVKKPFKLQEKFPRMAAASFLGRPSFSTAGFNLLAKLLTYDPEKRITAEDALNHPWFHESPLPTTKDFMPTFPAQHRQDRHRERIMKSPDPLEQLIRKDLQ